VAADRGELPDLPAHWVRHGDLLLLKHNQRLYLDVAVTRPTCDTTLRSPAVQDTPLHATKTVARRKHAKYDAIAATNGCTLLPFVLETHGRLGAEALRTLRKLAAHAPAPEAWLLHARKRIAVCLQRGNVCLSCR